MKNLILGIGFLSLVAMTTAPAVTHAQYAGASGGVVFGGIFGIGSVNTNNAQGEVLGASTEPLCEALLTSYLRVGEQNDGEQVKKLQTFLNTHMDANLPVTGVFGPMTFEAVKKFQIKYASEVLAPWLPFGLANAETATGYVYKTTQFKINKLFCATLDIPAPQLP